jgi:sec-independent protein translocase protein TatA
MELIIILGIVVVIFGAGRIADLGGALGKGIREFREQTKTDDEKKDAATAVPATPAAPVAVAPVAPAAADACPSCGRANPAGQAFCGGCGTSLKAPVTSTTA